MTTRGAVATLGRTRVVSGLTYSGPGTPQQYVVAVRDGQRWRTVATGRWAPEPGARVVQFRPVATDRVRLRHPSAPVRSGEAAVEVSLRGRPDRPSAARPSRTGAVPTSAPGRREPGRAAGSWGRWSRPIGLPLVPTTAVLLPHDKVLTMSAFTEDNYDFETDLTQVSILDVDRRRAGKREVSRTQHQMFCTGVSVLPDGRVLLTGGSSASNATIYDPRSDRFTRAPQMAVPRGYQTSVTLSDGRVFTVGGSWSGGEGGKDGEVLDADLTSWRRLPGISATSILTDDEAGVFRADNHAWLFADRRGWVFHAGPSRAMHWFDTRGDGATVAVGDRGTAPDQMNGNAVMYAKGRILTMGGAPSYSDSPATTQAWTIDIRRGPGEPAQVERVGDLSHPRALLNSVVLPTGEVLATGGQERSLPFSDADSVLAASLWSPRTGQWTDLAEEAIPRNYHSWSLLLQDGRVVAGGGGLCGDCEFNHPDVEIFTPPYLLRDDGGRRSRPHIRSDLPRRLRHGQELTVRTDQPIASWSLVRTGSVTHSIASDQRRVKLTSQQVGRHRYRLSIPPSPGVVVPGSHLLFAVDQDGTPSRGRWVVIR